MGYNASDEQVNAVCATVNFAYVCWLSRDFKDQYEDASLDGGPNFSYHLTLFLLSDFLYGALS
jgi:hypothetical protein